MSTANYFVANDYDLTLRLQELFQETVDLQALLDNTDIENIRLKEERRELTFRLKDVHHEISLLVLNMKHLLSDIETVKKTTPHNFVASNRNVH